MRLGKPALFAALEERRTPSAPGPRYWRGLCLMFVRKMLGLPAVHPSAKEAWLLTLQRDRHEGDKTPPMGVPVYWKVGKYWHVALSTGGGYVLSNDIKRRGLIDKVHIDTITRRWGAEYLGWAETLNGHRVYKRRPAVRLEQALDHLQRTGHYPALVGKALALEGLENDLDGYASWQRKLGYRGADADGRAGIDSLRALGRKHGFRALA